MKILDIKDGEVDILYHAQTTTMVPGATMRVLDEDGSGIICQVLGNRLMTYTASSEQAIQESLEERLQSEILLTMEVMAEDIKFLKVAQAKIRYSVKNGEWKPWSGEIPSRSAVVEEVDPAEVLRRIMPCPEVEIEPFMSYQRQPVRLAGEKTGLCNLIVGNRGSGKSAAAKHMILRLSQAPLHVPCICFDQNKEYFSTTRQEPVKWHRGGNFRWNLNETGPAPLLSTMANCYPFTSPDSPTGGVWQSTINQAFSTLGDVDLPGLLTYQWSQQQFIQAAIVQRLQKIHEAKLFAEIGDDATKSLKDYFEEACNGEPLVFDLSELTNGYKSALVSSVIKCVEKICNEEAKSGRGRYPAIFFDESHEYIKRSMIMSLISRGRHLGIQCWFISANAHLLPDEIFHAADNIVIGRLNHSLDVKAISQIAYADSESLAKFSQNLEPRRMLLIGQLSNGYPLHCRIDQLPSDVAVTGATRSTWERLKDGK